MQVPASADGAPLTDASRRYVMIDGFNLALEKGTGIATYARNLSLALRDLGCEVGVLYGAKVRPSVDSLSREVAFFDPARPSRGRLDRYGRLLRLMVPHRRAVDIPMSGRVVTHTFRARLPHCDSVWNVPALYASAGMHFHLLHSTRTVRFQRRPDLQHWTYPLPIRTAGVPNVYTLHDLVPLRLPYTTLDYKLPYLRLMRWIAKTADHIVTVSEASRRDIIDLLQVPPERVTNTYQAVNLPPAPADRAELARELKGLYGFEDRGYFLFFGSIEPKKNLGRLIEAYLSTNIKRPLVIIGAQAWKAEDELSVLHAHQAALPFAPTPPDASIIRMEYVPSTVLTKLIAGARAVLFPSLYEGFGLPVLEAMMMGTPVLCSNTAAMPEVAGDAALLVDPYDPQQIADGIRKLDSDDALCAHLSVKGPRQAQRFSPASYRQRLGEVYDEVLSRYRREARAR